ncbi:MAG TPA: AAA family ATPase [Trueperaceae bacterium]
MPLLERHAQLEQLGERLRAATQARGSLVLIGAEAGAGKTALVTEFGQRSIGRAHVLFGGCDPLTTPRPLSPLIDIALDPRAHLAESFASSAEPYELFTAVQRRLAGATIPIALVLEDIHWADAGTLDFLRFIGRRIADLPSMVVATYRDDEIGPDHPARQVVGDLVGRPSTLTMGVPALSIEAVRTLSGADNARAARIHRATDGNAFFVTEVIASGDDVPDSVRQAVMARAGRLGDSARRLVEVVASAPRSLEIEYALQVANVGAQAVDEAAAAGILLVEGANLRFRHDLARTAIEAATPLGRQFAWHRAMIDLLSEHEPEDYARLAHHAGRAHAWDLVVRFAQPAARQATERGAHREAAQFLRIALQRREHLDEATEARIRVQLATIADVLDLHAEALRECERAVEIRSGIGDPEPLAEALGMLGYARFRMGLDAEAGAPVEQARSLLSGRPLTPEKARSHYYKALVSMLRRRYEPAVEATHAALEAARALGNGSMEVAAMVVAGAAELVMGDVREGARLELEARQLADRLGFKRGAQNALWMLGSGAGEGRLYDIAIAALDELVEEATKTDDDASVAYGRAWLARIAFEQGRYDEAQDLAATVRPLPGHGFIGPMTAQGAWGRVQVRRGDDGGADTLRSTLAISPTSALQYRWSPVCGLAELAWLEARTGEIPRILAPILEQVKAADSPWARGEVSLWLWKAGEIDEPLNGAAEPFAALVKGDWNRSAELWDEIGCPYERAFALAHGDEAAMRHAVASFKRLGAVPAAARLAAIMRSQGIAGIPRGPRRSTGSHPANLTPRQAQVLELMAGGLTNAEIAQRLSITAKTAEHHVSAVLEKLAVQNRAAAVAQAVASGMVEASKGADSQT